MSETHSHKRLKRKAAGKHGQTEVPLSRGRRLDALSKNGVRATEIERSHHKTRLKLAAKRLQESKARLKVLQVPQKNMEKAIETMKRLQTKGIVSNLSGTKKIKT